MTTVPTLHVSSTAFAARETIPRDYTCDADDMSPPLAWSGEPSGTTSFAIVMDDPDAPVGTWVHWVAYNLPPDTTALPAGGSRALPAGAIDGKNSWGRTGYGGPCPPGGKPHRYSFRVYALDATLGLAAGASKAELERAMKPHVLAMGELVGLYGR